MPNQRISELGAAGSASLTHQYPVQEGAGNVRVSGSQIAAMVGIAHGVTGVVEKTADQAGIISVFAIDVTELGISVGVNKRYKGRYALLCDASATSEGIRIGLFAPGAPTRLTYTVLHWTSAANWSLDSFNVSGADPADTTSPGSTPRMFIIDWMMTTGAGSFGIVIPRIRAETGGQSVAVRAGSWGTWLET